jgi:tryptophan-rich sensory protein
MKLIIALIIFEVAFSLKHELLTSGSLHIALCLKNIIHQEFPEKSLLVISLPSSHANVGSEYLDVVDLILKDISNGTQWPLYVFHPGDTHEIPIEQPNKYHVGIIFAWENEENGLVEIVREQLETLMLSPSWNAQSKFVVVVTAHVNSPPHLVALRVSTAMWRESRIVNVIILIMEPNGKVIMKKGVDGIDETHLLNVYTWFPYNGRQCAEPVEVVLVNQCVPENGGKLSSNEPLFPNKIPNNLLGCTIKVATFHFPPYVIQTDNYTEVSGSTVYKFRGLELEYLVLVSEALNSPLAFSQSSPYPYVSERIGWCLGMAQAGLVDVAIGRIPQSLLGVISVDFTIPYIFDAVKWYVPCSKPALRTDKIMEMFAPSVWFSMAVVLILTSLVFWRTSKSPAHSVLESHCYRTALYCAYNVWSVFMGVSVPQLPRTAKLRILFLLYVCYCFAMNTVFQSFFTSFLVSPGYIKQIASIEDLASSDLIHGKDESLEKSLESIGYERLKLKEFVCPNHTTCLKRLFTTGDITTMTLKIDAEYVLSHEVCGFSGSKVLCTVNEYIAVANTVMSLTRGHPLFDKFNVIIRRCMETGLVDKYWSELNFNLSLENMGKFRKSGCEVRSNVYFVFSLSHLKAMFLVLGFGHVLSVIVFLFEFNCK